MTALAPPPRVSAGPATPPWRRTPAPVRSLARLDSAVRLAAAALLWLSLLLVTFWWVEGRGVQDLLGWTTALTSIGRLTGLVASVLLLTQVVLMARVPVLERAVGQDRLARQHRLVGFTSFTLMIAHVVLITWGYAAGSLLASPGTVWTLTLDYPGMLLAAAGTLCLVMVVVTSIRAARRRLRYESWHLIHLYAYLGVGLALPHQLWTGTDLVGSTSRTIFWWTAWATAAAAVVLWRVVLPLARTLRHQLRVTSVVTEAPGVVSVYMTGRHLTRLGAEAGQFMTWRFLGRAGWTRANPYSLSAAPDGHSLRITVGGVGDGSRALATLRPGTRVLVEGPHGRLTERPRTQRRVALISAGLGAAPIRALAEGLDLQRGEAVMLQRYTRDRLFGREIDVLARERGIGVVWLPGRRRHTESWLGDGIGPASDVDALRHWVPDIARRDVYLCGPEPWTALVRDTLRQAGLPPDQLHHETFSW